VNIGWEFENTVYINAPCWLVWQMCNDVLRWPALGSGVCRISQQGQPLDMNGRFIFTLRPLGLPVNVKAKVTSYRPWRLLAWQGKFWGIESRSKISFTTCDDTHTRLTFREDLRGLGLLLFSALFSMRRLSAINQRWLQSVGEAAEEQAKKMTAARGGSDGKTVCTNV
jgi:hypothetical protein